MAVEQPNKKIELELEVNGRNYSLSIEPWKILLDVLRDTLGLTGAKKGCDDGNCGACTVLVDGKAVKSCLLLIAKARGKKIETIEGLGASDKLHPLQESFVEDFAVQCGFCTPGMIMTAKAILDENPCATEEEIREGIHGNICRCTGYVKIVEAIESARDQMRKTS